MLLNLEYLARLLESDRDIDIEVLSRSGSLLVVATVDGVLWVVCILHEAALVLLVRLSHALLSEALVELVDEVELTCKVNHRACLATLVNHKERRDARLTRHEGIVGTEGRCDVNDTRTILNRNIVTKDYAEALSRSLLPVTLLVALHRLNPRDELLVAHTLKLGTTPLAHNLEWDNLIARLVRVKSYALTLLVEDRVEQWLSDDSRNFLTVVRVVGAHRNIVILRTHAERRIRWQGPRRSGPSEEHRCTPALHLCLRLEDAELSGTGGILNIAVATWLVELVCRETCTRRWRVWLDGVALVEEVLLVELLEQPPQGLDKLIVVGDIWIVHIHPVTHTACEVLPDVGKLHHRLTALLVVLLDGDLLADILLSDAELLLYAQLHRQTVCIPTRLTVHEVALLRLETAEYILDGTRHNMVDTWSTVSRRRSLVEHKCRMALAGCYALVKGVVLGPVCQHLVGNTSKVETLVFVKFLHSSQ